MAVRRSAMKRILPIPDDIWIHDQWIGLLSEQLGKVVFWRNLLFIIEDMGKCYGIDPWFDHIHDQKDII